MDALLKQIEVSAAEAEARLEAMVEENRARGEFTWFLGYIRTILPPGPTGYFFYEVELVRQIARHHRVSHLVNAVMQELSPKGLRTSLNNPL